MVTPKSDKTITEMQFKRKATLTVLLGDVAEVWYWNLMRTLQSLGFEVTTTFEEEDDEP